jgi:hypothetical protein
MLADKRVNVSDYSQCSIDQLISAINGKMHYLFSLIGGIDPKKLPDNFEEKLRTVWRNMELYVEFLGNPIRDVADRLSSQLR